MDMFALDSDNDSSSSDDEDSSLSEQSTDSTKTCTTDSSLDQCLEACTIATAVRGHPNKRRQTGNHSSDLRPIAWVQFNT